MQLVLIYIYILSHIGVCMYMCRGHSHFHIFPIKKVVKKYRGILLYNFAKRHSIDVKNRPAIIVAGLKTLKKKPLESTL